MIQFDVITLNQKIIDAEDMMFMLGYNNIHEVSIILGNILQDIVQVLDHIVEFSIITSSLKELTKIYKIIAVNPQLMNNLIVNTTLQTLKLAYCITINNEAHYIPHLQQTYLVIEDLLTTVNGGTPARKIPTIAEIISYVQPATPSIDIFGDEDTTNAPPPRQLRILIVDDELMHRTLMRKIVEPYGICDTADNGQTALRMFEEAHNRQAPYDMITLDIMMPIMDGQQTLKMIRRHERERGIAMEREVVIFMASSMDGDHVLEAFFRGHCTDYIKKPFSQEIVLGKMRSSHLLTT